MEKKLTVRETRYEQVYKDSTIHFMTPQRPREAIVR